MTENKKITSCCKTSFYAEKFEDGIRLHCSNCDSIDFDLLENKNE